MRPLLLIGLWLSLVSVVVDCDEHLRQTELEMIPGHPACYDAFATILANRCRLRAC